jgi:four helix bundle protein
MSKSNFENLRIYQLAEELAEMCWNIVLQWDIFAKDTIGRQFVKAADSIGANIAEGSGRNSRADNRRFAIIARGSLFELKSWVHKAHKRQLITPLEKNNLLKIMNSLIPQLSAYIKSLTC